MLVVLLLAGAASRADARFSEPDNVFYGTTSLDGVPVATGTVQVFLNEAPEPFLAQDITTDQNPDGYAVRIPLDSASPPAPGMAVPGDVARFFLNGDLAGKATLGARGTVVVLDLDRSFDDLDLEVLLADAPDPVTAGDSSGPLVYTSSVRNAGPNATSSAVLTQTLPPWVTFKSAVSSGGGTCAPAGATVSCNLPALARNATDIVTVAVDVLATAPAGTVLTTTVRVDNDDDEQSDPESSDNEATAQTTVQRRADLVASFVSATPNPADAGQQLTYQVRAANVGPSLATGVELRHTLAAGTLFVSVSNPTACSHLAGVVTCAFGSLSPGAVSTVDVVVSVGAGASGNLTSTAVVSGTESDPASANDTATSTVPVDRKADLSVVFVHDTPDPVDGDALLTVRLRLENLGPADSTGVVLTQSLPPVIDAQFVSATPAASCLHASGVVTCNFPALALNATQDVTVVAHVSANTTTQILTSTAHVAGNETDTVSSNDDATSMTTVKTADLLLTQSVTPAPAVAGAQLTYTLSLSNLGPDAARDVKLVDVLPADATFVSAALSTVPKLYTVSSTTTRLKTINPGTGATLSSVAITLPGGTVRGGYGLATNPWTGELWAALKLDDQVGHELVRLNRTTGVATSVGDTGLVLGGLAFDGQANLYAVTGDTGADAETLYILDTQTGFPTLLMDVASGTPGEVLGFERNSGLLYHLSGAAGTPDSVLETLDPQDLSFALLPPTGVPYGAPMALTQELSSSSFLLGDGTPKLYRITPEGLVSQLANPDHGVRGLAYAPNLRCEENAGTVSCGLGGMQSGESLTVSLLVHVDENAAGSLTNVASATAKARDADLLNNTDIQLVTPISRPADLSVAMTDAPDPVVAGETLTYQFTVRNLGPASATNASAQLTLPASTSFSNASAGCTNAVGVVTCAIGSLSANETSGQQTITALVASSVAEGTTLTAALQTSSSDETDPVSTNDDLDVQTSVTRSADLSVSATDTPDPVVAGQTLTYQLTVQNLGPSDSTDGEVRLTLPANTSFSSASMGCSNASGVVTCTVGDLALNAASVTLNVDALVASSVTAGATLTASVDATAAEPDPAAANDAFDVQTSVTRSADLSVSVTDTPDPVVAGQTLTYQLTVQNLGPSDSSNGSVTLTLPANTSFSSASTGCSNASGVVTCTVGDLTLNATSATLSVEALVASSVAEGAALAASVNASAMEPDPAEANDAFDVQTSVSRSTDVAVAHQAPSSSPVAGAPLSYTLRVTNNGPSDASEVILDDVLPTEVSFSSGTGAACAPSAPGSQTVHCTIGVLAAAASLDVTLDGTLASSVPDDAVLTNTAQISRIETDPQPANDTSTKLSVVNAEADLVVTQALEPNEPVAGETVTFRVTTQNLGRSDAQAVQLSNTLPAGVSFVSASSGCTHTDGVVSCSLGTVAAAASAEVEIVGRLSPSLLGTIMNKASASSIVFDPQGANNTDITLVAALAASSNLKVTVLSAPSSVVAGTDYTYTVQIENAGPSDAQGVQLSETLPAQVAFVSATPSTGTCSAAGGTVSCALGSLAASAKVSVALVMRASASLDNGSTLQNTVLGTSTVPDPDTGDNQTTLQAGVRTEADLDVTLTGTQSTRSRGLEAAYVAAILNRGPSDAHAVELTDELPAGMRFVSSSSGCTETQGTVHCAVGALASGSQTNVSFHLALRASQPTTVINTVQVSSADFDPTASNSTSTFELIVAPVVSALPRPALAAIVVGLALGLAVRRRRRCRCS